jgi:hypothetical protein
MLQARLWATEPAEARRLHARASRLFEQRGDLDAAVRHAVAAEDGDRAATIILAHAANLVLAGRSARLGQWLDLLGDHAADTDARVALAGAWYALGIADRDRLILSVLAAERAGWDGPLPDGSPSLAPRSRCCACSWRPTVCQVLRDAESQPPVHRRPTAGGASPPGPRARRGRCSATSRRPPRPSRPGSGTSSTCRRSPPRPAHSLLAIDAGDLDDADVTSRCERDPRAPQPEGAAGRGRRCRHPGPGRRPAGGPTSPRTALAARACSLGWRASPRALRC